MRKCLKPHDDQQEVTALVSLSDRICPIKAGEEVKEKSKKKCAKLVKS